MNINKLSYLFYSILILVSSAPLPPSTLQEDNYGNTPIMMGVRYGTSDVLMVMLNSRHDTFDALKRQADRIEVTV
jgi:hypothetical protein